MSAVGKWVAGIVSAVLITVLSAWALHLFSPSPGGDDRPTKTPAHPAPSRSVPSTSDPGAATEIYLNRDSGPAGSHVLVSGQGFDPEEPVTIRFHTEVVAHTTAGAQGSFDAVACTVPSDWRFTGQFDFVATGARSVRSAQREFRVT